MKTLRVLKCELKRVVLSYGFLACVLVTVVLCFTAEVYTDQNNVTYNPIMILLKFTNAKIAENYKFSSIVIFQNSVHSYLNIFIPVIAAFPLIPHLCAERNSTYIRYMIYRTGELRYYVTKFLTAMVGGGIAVTLGYIIYGSIVAAIFPTLSSYEVENEILQTYGAAFVVKQVCGMFLYGAFSVLPALFLSSFVKNRYIITCIPYMVMYMYQVCITKIVGNSYDNLRIKYSFYPHAIITFFTKDVTEKNFWPLVPHLSFFIITFLSFAIIMHKRRDLGE